MKHKFTIALIATSVVLVLGCTKQISKESYSAKESNVHLVSIETAQEIAT